MAVEPGGFRTNFTRSLVQPWETIGDYADTAGVRRSDGANYDGQQPGDPARAAQAIITAVESPRPPLMLVLGADALARNRDAIKELSADLDAWEHTSLGTSFPG